MSKNTFYFSHDSNARNDEKLLAVRMRLKAEGYGVYFMILEKLLESTNYMSVKDYNILAFDFRVNAGVVKSIVEDFKLFDFTEDGKYFFSPSLIQRMKPLDNLRDQRKKAGLASAEKRNKSNSCNDRSTTVQRPLVENPTKESKVDESKVDILLEKESKDFFEKNEELEKIEVEQIAKSSGTEKEKSCAKKEKLIMPENFLPIWDEWLQYRKARKFKNYAGCKWEQKAVDKLLEYSDNDPEVAKEILNNTYQNNYQGFFPIKQNINGNTNSQSTKTGNSTNPRGKISGRAYLASKFGNGDTSRDSESGNITIDVEAINV